MRNRAKKLMCFFLMMFLFISGFCFENNKEDARTVYAQNAPFSIAEDVLSSKSLCTPDAQRCTLEMLGGNGSLGLIRSEGHILRAKQDVRLNFFYLCQKSFTLKNANHFPGRADICLSLSSRTTLVTNYIHDSDGKKRL